MDEITAEHIPSLFIKLKLIVDNHNLYLESLNTYMLSKATNNYNMANMLEVSKDPSNLIEALTSVDGTTKPLKDKAEESLEAKEITTRTPGNVINKFEGINENQTGKKGISICAVGLKSYFGLTQYCNWVLNNGTSEDLKRLLLNSDGITIGKKTYYTLANIKPTDINTIKNSKLFKALSEVTQDEDIALTLSALLSLATDNAKELALSKLNAGTKMLGMYIYGLSIGMDFNDIADILMSPVGNIFKSMLEEDKFAQKDSFGIIDARMFNYFTKGPYLLLLKFDIHTDSLGNKVNRSPLKELTNILHAKLKTKSKLTDILIDIAKQATSVSRKLEIFEDIRNAYTSDSKEAVEIYNLLIDFVEDYIIQADVIYSNINTFQDIYKLSEGAAEMKTLGLVLSLNLGIKTSTDDFLNQLNNLRRAIYNKTGNLEDLVDLTKFAFDDSPYTVNGEVYDSYKDYIIQKYEYVKTSFNIFDVLDKVPHYMGYLLALVTDYIEVSNSFTFRSVDNLLLPLKRVVGNYVKEDKLATGILNYCGDYLLKHWMIDTNKLIIIPKGNQAFDKNGRLHTLKRDAVILLGTDWGNATFRLWMENEVIPNLKLGDLSDNKFIRDLGNDLFNKTVTKNPTVIYTLPINMLPSTDFERSRFNLYKSLFNALNRLYLYEATSYVVNLDGSISEKTELVGHSITDLFIYYAMIANGWKLNQSSLVPITEDLLNTGIIEEFHKYVTDIDKSGFVLSMDNIISDELLPYIAPSESPYSSNAEVIVARNSRTQKRVLMRRLSKEEKSAILDNDDFSNIFGNYKATYPIDNLNYFPAGLSDSGYGSQSIAININNAPVKVQFKYNLKSGNIIDITIDDTERYKELILKLKLNIKKIPTKKVNKARVINIDILKANIDNIINEC